MTLRPDTPGKGFRRCQWLCCVALSKLLGFSGPVGCRQHQTGRCEHSECSVDGGEAASRPPS